MDTRTTGERIADLIKNKNITYSELTEYCNKNGVKCSNATISNICNDIDKGYSCKLFRCIADFFDVSVDYLLCRTENTTKDEDLLFVCNYTGLSENIIKTLKTTYLDFVKYGTVSANELEYVKRNYNEILLIMLQNNFFLWNIMQGKLHLNTRIREERKIKQLLESNTFWETEQKEIGVNAFELADGYRYGDTDGVNLKKFLALEECRKIIDMYLQKDFSEYQALLAENKVLARQLQQKEMSQENDNSDGDNNANS